MTIYSNASTPSTIIGYMSCSAAYNVLCWQRAASEIVFYHPGSTRDRELTSYSLHAIQLEGRFTDLQCALASNRASQRVALSNCPTRAENYEYCSRL